METEPWTEAANFYYELSESRLADLEICKRRLHASYDQNIILLVAAILGWLVAAVTVVFGVMG